MDTPPRDGEFEVRYVAEGGRLQRVPLDEAGSVRFEAGGAGAGAIRQSQHTTDRFKAEAGDAPGSATDRLFDQ